MPATIQQFRAPTTQIVRVPVDGVMLNGELTNPHDAMGLVVFCRTEATPRANRDARRVAEAMWQSGLATLVFDLLTPVEEVIDISTHRLGDDLPLLAQRVLQTLDWVRETLAVDGLSIGLFGEGSGAGAALVAACMRPKQVAAVVSHTDALDLSATILQRVAAPTLLIVSGKDNFETNDIRAAFQQLRVEKELVMIESGAPKFEPAADLNEIACLATMWFAQHLKAQPRS